MPISIPYVIIHGIWPSLKSQALGFHRFLLRHIIPWSFLQNNLRVFEFYRSHGLQVFTFFQLGSREAFYMEIPTRIDCNSVFAKIPSCFHVMSARVEKLKNSSFYRTIVITARKCCLLCWSCSQSSKSLIG